MKKKLFIKSYWTKTITSGEGFNPKWMFNTYTGYNSEWYGIYRFGFFGINIYWEVPRL